MKKFTLVILFLIASQNIFAQSGWQWLNPVITGNSLYGIYFQNSETGYCAGDFGTLVKTTNSGVNWVTIRVPVTSRLNCIKFIDNNTGIIVGDSSKILRTTNSGNNWSIMPFGGSTSLKSIIIQNSNSIIVTGGNVILKSTNLGLNWNNLISLATNYDLCKIDYLDINNIFVVGKKLSGGAPPTATNLILKSTNAGLNWTEINPGGSTITSIIVVSSTNILCVGNGGGPFIYKSSDQGNTWQNKLGTFYETMSDIAFFNENIGVAIATGTNGRRFTTTNGGENWTNTTTGGSFFSSVFIASTTDAYMAGVNGCLRKTSNIGDIWVSINQGYNITGTFYSTQFFNELTGFVAGVGYQSGGSILKTTNAGVSWIYQQDSTISYGTLRDLYFPSINTGFVVGGNVILKTTNGGSLWRNTIISGADFRRVTFTDSLNGIAVGGSEIYKTTNGGISWYNQYHNLNVNLIGVHFINSLTGTVIGITGGGLVLRTSNGGASWQTQDLGISPSINYNVNDVYFINENTGFIAGEYPDYFKTTNGGNNWIKTTQYFLTKRIKFINESTGYFAAFGGTLYKTTNQGLSFIPISTGSSKDLYGLSFINENTGVVVGDLLTILKTTTGGLVNITQNESRRLHNYSLSQNYPNPFNPSTKINYEVKSSGFVSLKVFDLLGKEVAVLVNKKQNAGSYAVDFNSSEFNLPSGIYFYTLNAGEFKETRKMVLVK